MNKITCEHFNICGGCNNLNIDYETQLKNKQQFVKECLNSFNIKAGVNKTVGMFYPYKYRNKLHLAIRGTETKPEIGFFMENSNRVVSVNSCCLFDNWVKDVIEIIRQYILKFKISPYNKRTNIGILKYVTVRNINNEIILTLVVTSLNFGGRDWLLNLLKAKFKAVSLYACLNKRTDNAVFDERGFKHLGGYKKLRGEMLGVKFELSPNSFFQVNNEITNKIYKQVNQEINPYSNSVVLDLYSGIGITSCIFALNGAKVVSIESVPEAVNDAKNIIKLNGLENKITPYLGRCEQLITKINFNKIVGGVAEVSVFIDPPRIGCVKTVLDKILELKPNKIIYLSCNPETLARDLSVLVKYNYKLNSVTPFDMFPQTNHIETLAVLTKI